VRGKSAREVDLVRRDALLFRSGVGFWNNSGGIWHPGRISNGVNKNAIAESVMGKRGRARI